MFFLYTKYHLLPLDIIEPQKDTGKKVMGNIILSVIGIVFGIFCVALHFIISDMIIRILGVLLFIFGIIELIIVFISGSENDIENINIKK